MVDVDYCCRSAILMVVNRSESANCNSSPPVQARSRVGSAKASSSFSVASAITQKLHYKALMPA